MATDEQVTAKRQAVADLRQQIAVEDAKLTKRNHEADNDIVMAQLTAEETVLQADLKRVTDLAEHTTNDVLQAQLDQITGSVGAPSVEVTATVTSQPDNQSTQQSTSDMAAVDQTALGESPSQNPVAAPDASNASVE